MSTVSKIPRNRASRIAGPSRLPSRLVRPTYANNSSSAPNFVSSAKHMERKKESGKQSDTTERPLKNSNFNKDASSGGLEKDMDCNHNRQDLLNENSSGKCNLTTAANRVKNVQATEKYYEMQLPTVNTTSKSDADNCFPSASNPVESASGRKKRAGPNFRSMKPGYFMQKVNAIKDSQQKRTENSTSKQLPNTERVSSPPQTVAGDVLLSERQENTDFKTAASDDARKSARHILHLVSPRNGLASSASAVTSQSNDSQAVSAGSDHIEKQKKYLEVRTNMTAASIAKQSLPNDNSIKEQIKGDTKANYQSEMTSRRQYFRKPPLRNAKIARPVIRPKKTVSPLSPKPYAPQNVEAASGIVKPAQSSNKHRQRLGGTHDHSLQGFNQRHDAGREHYQRVYIDPACSPTISQTDSVASGESGFSPVASTVYLDMRVAPMEDTGSSKGSSFTLQSGTSCATDVLKNSVLNGYSSSSIGDILSPKFNNEDQHDMNLFAIPHGLSQAEGACSPEVPQKICSILPDINDVREVQSSPDCEVTSESSVETVISNAPSPNLLDRSDMHEDRPIQACYTGSDTSKDILGKSVETNFKDCNEFQCFDLRNGNHPANAMSTPKSHSQSGANLASYPADAKKLHTDFCTSPCLISNGRGNDFSESEAKNTELLKKGKNLFPDTMEQNDENCGLSKLIDLPSLHESDLMIDYNCFTEDECNSEAETDVGVNHCMPKEKKSNSHGNGSTAINVINKLLCEGLDGIAGATDKSVLSKESVTLFSDCQYTEDIEAANGAAVPPSSLGSVAAAIEPTVIQINDDELLAEVGTMRPLLLQLHSAIELGEVERKRQAEENKRLAVKNLELTRMVESLTHELDSLKITKAEVGFTDREIQVGDERLAGTAGENVSKFTMPNSQTSPAPQRFVSELSEEVGLSVRKAFAEIQSLKDVRQDFDDRLNEAEHHIASVLQLFKR